MLIEYPIFYRKRGVVTRQEIASPRLQQTTDFALPAGSILHYTDFTTQALGPNNNDLMFQGQEKPIAVDHVAALSDRSGNPRAKPFMVENAKREYHNAHRRTRQLRNFQTVDRDRQSLIVMNYAMLNQTDQYVRSFYAKYFRWKNVMATVIAHIQTLSTQTQRQHFIAVGIPRVLPSVEQLNASASDFTERSLKAFNHEDSFMLLEMWRWASAEFQDKSLFARLTPQQLANVNLVFVESGTFSVVNLGRLWSWKREDFDPAADPSLAQLKARDAIEPFQLQKRILAMGMRLMDARVQAVKKEVTPENTDQPAVRSRMAEKIKNDTDDGEDANGPAVDRDDLSSSSAIGTSTPQEVVNEVTDQILDEDDAQDSQLSEEEKLRQEDQKLDQDLLSLNEIAQRQEKEMTDSERTLARMLKSQEETSLEQGVIDLCNRMADDGLISGAEYRKFTELATKYKLLRDPSGLHSLEEFIKITPEELKIQSENQIPDSPTVIDKSMLKSTLLDFDKRYIETYLQKDLAGMVLNLQKAGIAVTGYSVVRAGDVMGEFYDIEIDVAPVVGKPSKLRAKIPAPTPDGNYRANGTSYRLRKQRGDLPIRKVSPSRVALTSYYGKLFINRSQRKVNDFGHWLSNEVMAAGLDPNDKRVINLMTNEVFDNTFVSPRAYSAISKRISSFESAGCKFIFDRRQILRQFDPKVLKTLEKNHAIIVGTRGEEILIMDGNHTLYTSGREGGLKPIGNFLTFLGLKEEDAPVESAGLAIFGKEIPIGIILAYQLGFEKLLRLLKTTPRRVPSGMRLNLQPNEYSIAFADETLIFDRENRLAAMVLAGFNEFHRSLRIYSAQSFDKRGAYLSLLENEGIGTRYLRELELLFKLYIDPITHSLLVEMEEPTTFEGLLLSACQKLLTDQHPSELDPAFMRDKGYERLAGALYVELIQSIRAHDAKFAKSSSTIEMNPYAVWTRISEDPAKMQIKEINPIESLKDMEAVTLAGTGGRSKRSMTKGTRAYHKNDMGVTSENTSDSSDVAINVSTSANPNYVSLRGRSSRFDMKERPVASLFSTSALNAVASDRDDPKRINFISIQNSHAIPCVGYTQAPVRTGYDSIIAHRTNDMFAKMAEQDGKVVSVDKRGVIVQYADGSSQGFAIGRRFGNAAGMTIPHSIVSAVKMGDEFKKGDAIIYNDGFFEPDFFNAKQLVLKNALVVKAAFIESIETLDDASGISIELSQKLTTHISEPKTIVVNFDQAVSQMVKVGDAVDSDSILCIIEDAITSNTGMFDEQSIQTLRVVGAQTPKAHMKGKVELIEVFYHGDKEEMHPTLKAMADASDRDMKKNAASTGKHAFTGAVDGSMRLGNNTLLQDQVAFRIYITQPTGMGVGDKAVVANQMKTIVADVNHSPILSESGERVDLRFGMQSVYARIVNSPIVLGTTNTCLKVIAKKMIAAYRS